MYRICITSQFTIKRLFRLSSTLPLIVVTQGLFWINYLNFKRTCARISQNLQRSCPKRASRISQATLSFFSSSKGLQFIHDFSLNWYVVKDGSAEVRSPKPPCWVAHWYAHCGISNPNPCLVISFREENGPLVCLAC